MKPIVCALLAFVSTLFRSRHSLQLEIVALRHQLTVYQRPTVAICGSAGIDTTQEWQYQVAAIGQIDEVKERFYAISVERRVTHPVVSAVVEAARESLFANE